MLIGAGTRSHSDPGATASGRGGRGGAKSIVNVTISLAEFLKLFHALRDGHHLGEGLEEQTCSGGVGEIDGLGYVPAWVARNLVADLIEHKSTGFRAVVFDENTGTFLAASSPSYRCRPTSNATSNTATGHAGSLAAANPPHGAMSIMRGLGWTAGRPLSATCLPLPPASPVEANTRLASRFRRRSVHLDHPHRTHPHHPPL